MTDPLLDVRNLSRRYMLARVSPFSAPRTLLALDSVNLTLHRGRSLGIVGESGSGKSTLARIIMALDRPSGGSVQFLGRDLFALPHAELRRLRPRFQMIFQDPYSSLDPRMQIMQILMEPLSALPDLTESERRRRVSEQLQSVGLRDSDLKKYPHEFSGGQRQRIAIARALITRPDMVIADEPLSALDVSVQAQVLNLLAELQRALGVTYVLISHDLSVVHHICDDIVVMYAGKIVERGPTREVLNAPCHPYTKALLAAIPQIALGQTRERRSRPLLAAPANSAAGCAYVGRCAEATGQCRAVMPSLREIATERFSACHYAEKGLPSAKSG